MQKEYQSYDLVSRWSFKSTDVTFFESTSYFSKKSSPSNVSSNPLPLLVSTSLPHGSITDSSTRPLQVYSCHRPLSSTLLDVAIDLPSPPAAPAPPLPSDSNLPIAVRKCKRSCTTHPQTNYLSFTSLSPMFRFPFFYTYS